MTRLDESVQLNDDSPRCPRCAKRVTADTAVCPSCGYEFLPHRARIHCQQCGKRIPADAPVCPRCGKDPRVSRFPRSVRIGAIVVAALLVVCMGWVIFRAVTTNALSRALGLGEPTPMPRTVVQVIYVVATSIPPTPTLVPTITPTPTARVTPTATRRNRTPAATPSVAPTSVLAPYPALQLAAPLNATIYSGADANIALEWQPVPGGSLRENEWYAISISFTARDGAPAERKGFSKETRWSVPHDWWNDVSPDARTIKWNVGVVRIEGIDPFVSPTRVPASAPGATRTFIWK